MLSRSAVRSSASEALCLAEAGAELVSPLDERLPWVLSCSSPSLIGKVCSQAISPTKLIIVARESLTDTHDDTVEAHCAVYSESEADDLQRLESLPAQGQREEPDQDSAALHFDGEISFQLIDHSEAPSQYQW